MAAANEGTFVTKPGYWLVEGVSAAGNGIAGVVKFTGTGRLPNAQSAFFVGKNSVNTNLLQQAIGRTAAQGGHASWLFEVPSTIEQIAKQAEAKGHALFTSTQAGVQPTNDIAFAALLVAAPIGAGVAGAGAAGEGAAAAGAGAAGVGAGEAAAGGGAAGGVASKVASGVKSVVSGATGSGVLKDATAAGLIAVALDKNLWKGLALTIAGAILILLAMRGAMQL